MGGSVKFPWLEHPLSDIYFSSDDVSPNVTAYSHSHAWRQFNYVSRGLMYFNISGSVYITPPGYGVWIPPCVEHSAHNIVASTFRPIHLSLEFSKHLPVNPCALQMGSILRSIIADFADRHVSVATTPQDIRLAEVVLDQLKAAPIQECFLPYATSKELQSVLQCLQDNPGDDRSLAEWAKYANVTVRTLERHCLTELGITLIEWRQRLRFMRAIDSLATGRTVQQIAFDLNYSTPSAFIAMFRRMAGTTPEQYRLRLLSAEKSPLSK